MAPFYLLILFQLTANIEAIKPKSVNLALETVLEFSNKENAADLKFLDNVQQFLDQVNSAVRPARPARRRASADSRLSFTDFIRSAVSILQSYDDDDLEDVFAVFDDEIRKYHYRGCKFYELIEDQNVRRFVAKKLDRVKEKPAAKLRKILDAALEAIESDAQAEFLEYVDTLYRQGSDDILKTFLRNLHAYSKSKRANLNLVEIVRDGIRSVLFDHYSALNANARRDFKIKLETSWKNFNQPERIEHRVWTAQYTNMNNKAHPSRTYGHADDVDREAATPAVTPRLTDTERDVKKHRIVKYEVDIMKVDNDDENTREPTARTVKMKSPNAERSISPELSNAEGNKPAPHRHKPRNKKHRVIKEKLVEKKKSKHKPHKKHRHKKLSSFVTLYPAEITLNTRKRYSVRSTTHKPKLYTLWEENIRSKKKKKEKKHGKRKLESNFRINFEKSNVISETDTIINVNKATLSSEDASSLKRSYKTHRQKLSTKELQRRRTIAITEREHKPTKQPKILRKHDNTPEATSLSEEGMSIESYEHHRRSMTVTDTNTSIQGLNVLRRINNLERQMEEIKSKIDTKLPTTETTIENTPIHETEFEPLQFWEGPTTTVANYKITTIANVNSTNLSTPYTEPFEEHNTTEFQITNSDGVRSDSNETNVNDLTFRTGNDTRNNEDDIDSVSEPIINDTVFNDKFNFANAIEEDNNEIGLDFDNGLDSLMKKYNISDTDLPKASTSPFDFDMFLKVSKQLNNEKVKKESIFERDMKVINETIKYNDVNNFENPLDAVFDDEDKKAKNLNDFNKNNTNVTETNAINTSVNSFNNSILDGTAPITDKALMKK